MDHNSRLMYKKCILSFSFLVLKCTLDLHAFQRTGEDGPGSPQSGGVCQGNFLFSHAKVCVYYCSTYYKAVRVGGGGDSGGHVLRETTSRGPCGIVCPSRTSEEPIMSPLVIDLLQKT